MSNIVDLDGGAKRIPKYPLRVLSSLLLLLIGTPTFAGTTLEYDGALETNSPVLRPTSVSLGQQFHSICVTDAASHTLDIFDSAGFHRYRTDEAAGISVPRDGTIDSDGRFLYIETGGSKGGFGETRTIARLSFLGEPDPFTVEDPYEGWRPLHLAIGVDGHYLTVDGFGMLAKHDAVTGLLLWTCQVVEPGFERIDLVGRPAQGPDGRIYVPHGGLREVLVVSSRGERTESFGVPGAKRGELTFPVGVAVTGAGQILVLDRIRHRVLLYDASHRFVDEFGRLGRARGDLYHPVSIAASPDGRVFIAQGFEGRVQRYRLRDSELARNGSNRSS